MKSFHSLTRNNFMGLYCDPSFTDNSSKVQKILSTSHEGKDQKLRFICPCVEDPHPYRASHLAVLHKSIEN